MFNILERLRLQVCYFSRFSRYVKRDELVTANAIVLFHTKLMKYDQLLDILKIKDNLPTS